MAFRITVTEIKLLSETEIKNGAGRELYSQTVETLDLPTLILAVNKGGVTETLKDWFKKLTDSVKQ